MRIRGASLQPGTVLDEADVEALDALGVLDLHIEAGRLGPVGSFGLPAADQGIRTVARRRKGKGTLENHADSSLDEVGEAAALMRAADQAADVASGLEDAAADEDGVE